MIAGCGCQLVNVAQRQFCPVLEILYEDYLWARRYAPDWEAERAAFVDHFGAAVKANRK